MLSRSRDALSLAAAGATALVAGWLVTFHLGFARWLDAAVLQGFVALRRPAIDPFVQALADVGDAVPMVLVGLALVAWAWARGRPRVALAVPAVLLGAELTTQVLKPLLADPACASASPTAGWRRPRGPAGTPPARWRWRCAPSWWRRLGDVRWWRRWAPRWRSPPPTP
jgi:hypothetical protein